ncbi:MAG: hypothetical protein ACE5NN_00620 [Candidatus Bathyarchaeia archaeon]
MTTSKDYIRNPNTLDYIDLLVSVLAKHEKNLNRLIERLDRVSDVLDEIAQRITMKKRRNEGVGFIYI